jgi:hypothetical protein
MNFAKQLNDPLDDLFANAGTPEEREAARPARPEAAAHQEKVTAGYFDKCYKCDGSGMYYGRSSYGHRCFACSGKGGVTYKTSPEQRAKRKQAKANKIEANRDEWIAANPAEYAWLKASAGKQRFAASVLEAVHKYGGASDGQTVAIKNAIAREAEWAKQREAERAAREAAAPVADSAGVERLKDAFDKAIAYSAAKGLKLSPRITVDGIAITPAKANSANPGALYVKTRDAYLGKITGGKFIASRECTDDQQARVLAFVADPAEAAKVYGQTTGTCCVCNATLRSDWKLKGIGPICAEKFGW